MKKKILFYPLILLLLFTSLTGCNTNQPPLTGTVNVELFIGSIAKEGISGITAIIDHPGKAPYSATMHFKDNYALCQFTNMPIGSWNIRFSIVTELRTFEYASPKSFLVEANKITYCSSILSQFPTDHGDKIVEADAGSDQTVQPDTVVTLDGSKSVSLLNPANLYYQWNIITKPDSSTATLQNPTSANPTFIPDAVGSYDISLVVHDGIHYSTPDKITIFVCSSYAILSFDVVDAEYSKQLDKIIMVSSNPNQLHIYDPLSNTDTAVELPLAPTSVSVGPDGTHAAIGHNQSVSYVNLTTPQIEHTFNVFVEIADLVLAGNGYIYAIRKTLDTDYIRNIEIASGHVTYASEWHVYSKTKIKLHPSGKYIYGIESDNFPQILKKYNIQNNTIEYLYDSTHQVSYTMGNDLWLSKDGLQIFVTSGYILNASADKNQDMVCTGRLTGVNFISGLDHSLETNQMATLLADSSKVNLYSYQNLTYQTSLSLPGCVVNRKNYTNYGRYIFYSNDGKKLFAITQTDNAAGISNDFAVVGY